MNVSDELKIYIDCKEHTGAFLLTGKWGCGKTYLIKNLKSEIDSDDKVMLIISLFGIDSVEMLTKAIKEQIIEMALGTTKENQGINKIQKIVNMLLSFSDTLSSIKANVSLTIYELISIKKNINILGKNKEIILVFDDFERSNFDTIELLGIINEFCENRHIKTIIIADEEKIVQTEELNKTKSYKDFKEKVIQSTCMLSANYGEVIGNIISNYSETYNGYHEFLVKNIDLLKQVFYESESNNLRTIKAILIGFERVYNTCRKESLDSNYIRDIFYSYSVMIFESRKGNFQKGAYGYLFIDTSFNEKYLLYNKNGSALGQLKQYVCENDWSEKEFVDEIIRQYKKSEYSNAEKFLNYDFWGFNEEIIDKGLTDCLSDAYDGNLSLDGYINILNKVATLTKLHYELPCQIDYQNMFKGLEKKKNKILYENYDEPKKRTYIENKYLTILGEDAVELNKKIEFFSLKIDVWSNRKKIINQLKNDRDLTHIYDKSLDCFDSDIMNVIFEIYKDSDNYDRRETGRLINSLNLTNRNISTQEDMEVSLRNIKSLKNQVLELCSEESDRFNIIIHNEIENTLSEKENMLVKNIKQCNSDNC